MNLSYCIAQRLKLKALACIFLALQTSTIHADPPTFEKTAKGYRIFYCGGDNWLTSPKNSSDWSKRTDIRTIQIHQDVTNDELQYICRTPSLENLIVGTSPDYISCRPNLLDALSKTTNLTSLTLSLDSPHGTPFQPSNLDSFLKINPDNKLTSLKIDIFSYTHPVFTDDLATNLLIFKKLQKLEIFTESKFTHKFFTELRALPDLKNLTFMNESMNDKTLEAIGSLKISRMEMFLAKIHDLSLSPLKASSIEDLKLIIYNQDKPIIGENFISSLSHLSKLKSFSCNVKLSESQQDSLPKTIKFHYLR